MREGFWIAFIAALTLLFGAAYSLWMVKRVFYGTPLNKTMESLKDIDSIQWLTLGSLAILILVVGLFPSIITDFTNVTVDSFIHLMNRSKLPIL